MAWKTQYESKQLWARPTSCVHEEEAGYIGKRNGHQPYHAERKHGQTKVRIDEYESTTCEELSEELVTA